MQDETVWEGIGNAPFERELEIAVIERGHVHQVVFACRRVPNGWVKAQTNERIAVNPTHWRPWNSAPGA
jgi:hypothetical protein